MKGIKLDAPVGIALAAFALFVIAYCFSQYSPSVEKENAQLTAELKETKSTLDKERADWEKEKKDAQAELEKTKGDLEVTKRLVDQRSSEIAKVTAGNEVLGQKLAEAHEIAKFAWATMNDSSLSDRQRKEYNSLSKEVNELNNELSQLRIEPTYWPKIDGRKAVATFQIYKKEFEQDQALGRGAGLFDFESEKYSVEGDYNNKLTENLRSEVVGIVCEAAARAMNQGVSLQQAIAGMAKPTGYDLSKNLLPELAEFAFVQMRLKMMAAQALLLVRGYADGERADWQKQLDPATPATVLLHENASSDPTLAEYKLTFKSTETNVPVGRNEGNSTVYNNKDLPNLRAETVTEILRAIIDGCPAPNIPVGTIPIEILEGWVYPNHSLPDRKVRAFLLIFLKNA